MSCSTPSTCKPEKNFNVIFYNQTLLDQSDLFARLRIRPEFDYQFFSVERRHFLGNFPLWDLYTFHRQLLEADLLGDYFMSLHMEEFFDIDYVENVTKVLEAVGFDILLGNLCRTRIDNAQIADILEIRNARDFANYLRVRRLKGAPHWAFQRLPASLVAKLSVLKNNPTASLFIDIHVEAAYSAFREFIKLREAEDATSVSHGRRRLCDSPLGADRVRCRRVLPRVAGVS